VSAPASPETQDARARELARHSRRLFGVIALCTWVLPPCFVFLGMWRSDGAYQGWGVLLIVVPGYLLIFSILIFGARSRAKKVRRTSEAVSDAYLVCEATDPQGSSVGVRVLVVQPSGVSLCNGSGANLLPVWELAWADIVAAEVSEYRVMFNTRPAVRITCRDGRTRFLLLVDKKRLTDALMDFPRRVAALVNDHAGR
jgi:hypothetical protein